MKLALLTPIEWASVSEAAHKLVFGTLKPASFDRLDGAIGIAADDDEPIGYVTFREMDHESAYWQFGGIYPRFRGTRVSFEAYQNCIALTRAQGKYKRIATLIENTNTVMLKFAMKVGFRIIGVRCVQGSILVEHLLEFQEEK